MRVSCRPIIEVLRMADADVPSCGKIYDACQRLHEHARTLPGLSVARRKTVVKFVRDRWDMLTSDLHCAGYVLDPEFVEHNSTANKVSSCIKTICFQKSVKCAPQYSSNTALHQTDDLMACVGGDGGIHECSGEGIPR